MLRYDLEGLEPLIFVVENLSRSGGGGEGIQVSEIGIIESTCTDSFNFNKLWDNFQRIFLHFCI